MFKKNALNQIKSMYKIPCPHNTKLNLTQKVCDDTPTPNTFLSTIPYNVQNQTVKFMRC